MNGVAKDDEAGPLATVVIRAKDEALHIGRTLALIRSQTIADRIQTIVVVDCASRDETAAIALSAGVEVRWLGAGEFSYGGALNVGCEHALGEIVIALSAHAFPRSPNWAEDMLAAFDNARVACACGASEGPTGAVVRRRIVQDERLAKRHPFWGYSSHAGAFRRPLWQLRPFRTDMPYTEDKEWAWYWLTRGYLVVLDPLLVVDHEHDEGLSAVYRRAAKMWTGYGMFLNLPPYRVGDLVSDWRAEPSLRGRASPYRLATLLGCYSGRRSARTGR